MRLLIVALLAAISYAQTGEDIDTATLLGHILDGEEILDVASYKICDWKRIHTGLMNDVQFTIDGKDKLNFKKEVEDVIVEGSICEQSSTNVVMVIDDKGLRGSIHTSTKEFQINPESGTVSKIEEIEAVVTGELEDSESVENEKQMFFEHLNNDRRNLDTVQPLYPGSVPINLHIELDHAMVVSHSYSEYYAANYMMELISIVSEDVFYDLGFQLKVVSMNIRSQYVSCDKGSSRCTVDDYLEEVERIPIPEGVHLVYFASNFGDGGIAYTGGIYNKRTAYGVFASLNPWIISIWDRKVIAHEIGHSLGARHTHDLDPPLDTCGVNPPDSCTGEKGTIMSYCQKCPGEYDNILMHFSEQTKNTIVSAYHQYGHTLADSQEQCGSLPELPTTGLPFYFKDDECLEVDMSGCVGDSCTNSCTQAGWQYDPLRKQVHSSVGQFFYCWKAADDCSGISIQNCDNQAIKYHGGSYLSTDETQQFHIRDQGIEHERCGLVKASNGVIGFEGTPVKDWCTIGSLDVDEDSYTCDNEVVELSCGSVVTGLTNAYCLEKEFTFVAPGDHGASVDISTCGSDFDTDLLIEADNSILWKNDFLRSSDPTRKCTVNTFHQAELLNMKMQPGKEYKVLLEGFCRTHGAFEITVTCREFLTAAQNTVNFPTQHPTTSKPTNPPSTSVPTNYPTTEEPTKDPTTEEPTTEPSTSPIPQGFVCEDTNSWCATYEMFGYCRYSWLHDMCAATCGICKGAAQGELNTLKTMQKVTYSLPIDFLAFIGVITVLTIPCYYYSRTPTYTKIDDMDV